MTKKAITTLATRAALGATLLATMLLTGCVTTPMPSAGNATLTPPTRVTRDLTHLPPPKGRIVAAVYGFRDLTGQYKPSPDSSFSSQVTQCWKAASSVTTRTFARAARASRIWVFRHPNNIAWIK